MSQGHLARVMKKQDIKCVNSSDQCPLNIIFVTNQHMFYVDAFFFLQDDEVNGDGVGQLFMDWFTIFFGEDCGVARRNVSGRIMDNVYVQMFQRSPVLFLSTGCTHSLSIAYI